MRNGMSGERAPEISPAPKSPRETKKGIDRPRRSACCPVATAAKIWARRKELKIQPYSPTPPRSRAMTGAAAVIASPSKATTDIASKTPTVNAR